MTRPGLAAALLLLAAQPLAAQQGDGFTFYQDGRVLARQTFPGQVPAGASTRALPMTDLDLGTLLSLDPAIQVSGATLGAGPDQEGSLRLAIGQELSWVSDHDTVRATVLGTEPLRVRMPDGSVRFGAPGAPLFPASLVGDDAALVVALETGRARPALPLAWYAQGGGWQASYSVMLGSGKGARVSGRATVRTGSVEAESAEVQLLAGNVGYEGRAPRYRQADEMMVARAAPGAPPTEESVGEAHLYTLPGRHRLERNAQLMVALFATTEAPVEKRFTTGGAVSMYGPLQQHGEEALELPVAITYELARERKTAFGDLPLPGGTWRLFEPDAAGRAQLIGVASTGHTAAGQPVRLQAGAAFDLTARLLQETYTLTREGRTTIATADYRVTLASAGTEAVTIDVIEQRAGQWTVLASSVPAERVSSTVTRFRVPVPAGGETVLTYRIEARW